MVYIAGRLVELSNVYSVYILRY